MIAAMTDRGTPSTDAAAACPFVAFDDDRDARSTAPDHRHRCFAEAVPAPRAIAHQDAYCLSPAFAVCPAFQDWARREAAAARSAPASPAPAARPREEDTSGPMPLPPAEREPRHAPAGAAQPIPPRKQPPRDWAAPPPWAGDTGADDMEPPASAAPGAIPGWMAGAAAGGAAAAGTASRSRSEGDWGGSSRGLADSAAARIAGPDRDLPAPARPTPSWVAPEYDADDDDDDAYDESSGAAAIPPIRPQSVASKPPASRPAPAPAQPGRPVPPPRTPAARDGAKPVPRDAQELFGPAWERPRRFEAYPSLRTRVGLPSFGRVPGLALGAIAIVVAAAFLFLVTPMLLGLGKDHAGAGASVSPSEAASAGPTATPRPTAVPKPTATTYTVVAHDTLSGIAQKFGVTTKALLKANPQIKNANSIKIGDVLNIPAPAGSAPSGAVSGASPSAVHGASAAP